MYESKGVNMANECMDTVVFYAESEDQEKGLSKFREAVMSCYGIKMPADESSLIQIFKINGITANDISLRSNVVYSVFDSGYVKLECISAWSPPYEAYSRIAESFWISFVLQAEEPGFSIYINTDMDKKFLTVEYKVYLRERPEDHSLDSLFYHAGGDTDFYFDSDGELLEWFREYGSVNAGTVQELRACMDEKYVCLYEFENPYQ